MQIIAGLSKTLYWIANYLFDFSYLFFVLGIGTFSMYLFDEYKILSPDIGVIFLLFIMTALNGLLITYFIININMSKGATDVIIKYSFFIVGLIIGVYDVVYHN